MINTLKQHLQKIRKKRFYSNFINRNDLCFDIGANLGIKSNLFLSLGARVVAFEPQSACANSLLKIKNQHFNFVPIAVGGSNEERELNLATHIEVATFSTAFIEYFKNDRINWNDKEVVTVKKLDTLIQEFGVPQFCKIDVEGYEWEILSKLSHTIPVIEFEFTGGFIPNTLKTITHLDNGFTLYNYILNEYPKFELEGWVACNQMIEVISNLPTRRLHGNLFVKTEPAF